MLELLVHHTRGEHGGEEGVELLPQRRGRHGWLLACLLEESGTPESAAEVA